MFGGCLHDEHGPPTIYTRASLFERATLITFGSPIQTAISQSLKYKSDVVRYAIG